MAIIPVHYRGTLQSGPPSWMDSAWSNLRGVDLGGGLAVFPYVGPFGLPAEGDGGVTDRSWISNSAAADQFQLCMDNLVSMLVEADIAFDETDAYERCAAMVLHVTDPIYADEILAAFPTIFSALDVLPIAIVRTGQTVGSAKVTIDAFVTTVIRRYMRIQTPQGVGDYLPDGEEYKVQGTRQKIVPGDTYEPTFEDKVWVDNVYLWPAIIDAIKLGHYETWGGHLPAPEGGLWITDIIPFVEMQAGNTKYPYYQDGNWKILELPPGGVVAWMGLSAFDRNDVAFSSDDTSDEGVWNGWYSSDKAADPLDTTIKTTDISTLFDDRWIDNEDPDGLVHTDVYQFFGFLDSEAEIPEALAALTDNIQAIRIVARLKGSGATVKLAAKYNGTPYDASKQWNLTANWRYYGSYLWPRRFDDTTQTWSLTDLTTDLLQFGVKSVTGKAYCDWIACYVYTGIAP